MSLGSFLLLRNWWKYYALKRKRDGIHSLHMRNGLKFALRANSLDKTIFKEIWIRKVYARHGLTIEENDTVVDIGGHVGIFALYAAHKASNGKVIVYEPHPENYSMLKTNIESNGLKNILPVNEAVAGHAGKSMLHVSEDRNTGGHSLYFNHRHKEQLEVATTTLSQLASFHRLEVIHYLKLDCEGAEFDILFNDRDALQKVQKIAVECHEYDKSKPASMLVDILANEGFSVFHPATNNSYISMIYGVRD